MTQQQRPNDWELTGAALAGFVQVTTFRTPGYDFWLVRDQLRLDGQKVNMQRTVAPRLVVIENVEFRFGEDAEAGDSEKEAQKG